MKLLRKNLKVKTKKCRRGRRKSSKNINKSLRFLGVNSAGLSSKLLTFKKVVAELKPSVFFIEETKLKDIGKIKLENYIIFEKIRQNRDGGGGLALGCIKELKPVWVREGEEQVEALSVNIFVKNMKIRCCVAYGCQESDASEKKDAFWKYLDEDVMEAKHSGEGFVLQFDGNLWAGNGIVPNDPRPQNRNGKLFEQFLSRHPHLSVVNSLDLCEGLITRSRLRDGKLEESVLDFFVVCNLILPHITRMVIDEQKKYVLTNYGQVQRGGKATNSDHATEYIDIDLKVIVEKPKRNEIWNFKSKEGQEKFKTLTSETNDLSNCFKNNLPVQKQIENWWTVFQSNVSNAFQKIRITKKRRVKAPPPKLSKLIDTRNELLNYSNCEQELEMLNQNISNMEAQINRDLIVNNFQKYGDDPENVNLQQVWKTMGKIWPKVGATLPIAKQDHLGKIISDPGELKKLYAKEYKERLRVRPVRPDLEQLENRKKEIFEMKLRLAETKSSKLWTLSDLETALADLKKNKARDNDGLINEIFKKDVIGKDLKLSLLLMYNSLRQNKMIPIFMNYANITTVSKKGSKLLLVNQRGIFRVSVLRYILMRLIYNEKYQLIDSNMSDCQMGGRKNKGCRNNIFIINGIIHDVMSSKRKSPVVLQIYDYKQMFDAIDLQQALSDIYDVGMDDDNLCLLYQGNKDVRMAVNTPSGPSERQSIENVVLQGDTFGSILASVQVDSIGKEVEASGYGYQFKDELPVSLLGLVDDMIGVSDAGIKAQQLNALLNVKTAEKRLQFGVNKCKSMLISKNQDAVINNHLTVDKWVVEHVQNKSTGENDMIEKYEGRVNIEKTDNQKYLGFVLSSTGDNMVNISAMRTKSIWIIRKIFQKLDSLHLQKYYFECGLIFLNVMLRSSIFYACETYYHLKETEIRQLERIEECFLRKLFKTSKGCPISQLYLEAGHTPARYYIKQTRILFLKSILQEDPSSMISRFFYLQLKKPTRGDWASSCLQDLQDLQIEMSLDEIKKISKTKLSRLIQNAIQKRAFEYLLCKQGSKGQEIGYTELKMAEYLLPSYENITIEERRNIFSIRNRMIPIPSNFPKNQNEEVCECSKIENMKHIYQCEMWNKENENEIPIFENIFGDNISELVKVNKQFQINYNRRERYKLEVKKKKEEELQPHVIQISDPLSSLF